MRRLLSSTILLSVAAGVLTAGITAADAATCTYQPSQHPGFSTTRPFGSITGTDGGQRFFGSGFNTDSADAYPHGVVWNNGTVVGDFGPLGTVIGVNRSGDAAGHRFADSAVLHNGKVTRLAAPPQITRSIPLVTGITGDGLVVGSGRFDDGTYHVLTWRAENPSVVTVLGTLESFTTLRDVGDNGQTVGAITGNGKLHAVSGSVNNWSPLPGVDPSAASVATDVAGSYILGTGTIPGAGAGIVLWDHRIARPISGGGTPTDVNDSGVVSGSQTVNGQSRGFVVRDGTRTTLQPLPGFTDAQALTVTDDGRVGGLSSKNLGGEEGIQSVPTVWICL